MRAGRNRGADPPSSTYILYRPFKLNADGDTVRHQVEFMYRHLQSGEVLAGRFRMVMQVKDGLIVRADEYCRARRP
jgi:ketosteroid isomerase-like protein